MREKKEKLGLLEYAGRYRTLTVLSIILSSISSVVLLLPLIYIWKVMDETFHSWPDLGNLGNLPAYGWAAVLFSVLGMLLYFSALMCSHFAAFRIARNMRSTAMHHVMDLPLGFFQTHPSGKLRRMIDESAGRTETFLAHQLPDLAGSVTMMAAMFIIILYFDWRLGLMSMIPIGIGLFFVTRMMGKHARESMEQYQNALDNMNGEAVEYIRGMPVVKTFQQSIFSFKRFHESIMKYKEWVVNYTLSMRIPMCLYTVSINAVFALLIPAGIIMIATASDYNAFLSDLLFYIIFTPMYTLLLTKIMFSTESLMQASDGVKRVNMLLEESPLEECGEPEVPRDSSIVFDDVSFRYPESDDYAIRNVSFSVEAGESVALVGPSGSGKTTVARLIPRFWDVTEGSVSIGGADVRKIGTPVLMDSVSTVFQNIRLNKMSIIDNIRMSRPDATREEIVKAAEAARCMDFIERLPDGLDSMIGSKGVYLSGGEAQRIAIARAILKDAPIVILDEATAFADPENEHHINLALLELMRDKTVLIIAHRLSSIRNVDRILVLEGGRVVQEGDHDELISAGGLYSSMWDEYGSSVYWKLGRGDPSAI